MGKETKCGRKGFPWKKDRRYRDGDLETQIRRKSSGYWNIRTTVRKSRISVTCSPAGLYSALPFYNCIRFFIYAPFRRSYCLSSSINVPRAHIPANARNLLYSIYVWYSHLHVEQFPPRLRKYPSEPSAYNHSDLCYNQLPRNIMPRRRQND